MLAIVLLVAPPWTPPAFGSSVDSPAPLDVYRNTTQRQLARCADAFRRSLRRLWLTRTASDYHGCIRRARADADAKLTAAARTVHQPDARRALVAYHTAFVAAMAGIEPYADETEDGYEQRQSMLLHAMSHAWSLYELAE